MWNDAWNAFLFIMMTEKLQSANKLEKTRNQDTRQSTHTHNMIMIFVRKMIRSTKERKKCMDSYDKLHSHTTKVELCLMSLG